MTVKYRQWLTFTQEFELVIVDCDKKLGYLGRKTVCSYKLTFNDEKTVDKLLTTKVSKRKLSTLVVAVD